MKEILKKDYFIIIILLVIIFTFRLPFLPKNINFNNDAPRYSKNIEKKTFDGTYSVHVPGYVSFIYLGRIINLFTNNPVSAQHVINIILMILITIFFYFLLKSLGISLLSRFLFSLLFSFNNILLLGSITGGNRLFLTFASIILIFIAIKIVNENKINHLIIFAFALAFLMGFRQDLSFYFIPLYLYLIIKVKDIKIIIFSLLIFTLTSLTWFIPLMMEYGGLKRYLDIIRGYDTIYDTSLIFSEEKFSSFLNIFRVFIYIFYAFIFTAIPLIITIFSKKLNIPKYLLIIIILSTIPALCFQLFVHNGNYVHLASIMTPLFLIIIYNFKVDSIKKIIVISIITIMLLSQFYLFKMFNSDKFLHKVTNVLFLQYSYDGVKSTETLRLKMLKDDLNLEK